MNNLFLGFDCSTQSFKVIIIDISDNIIYQDKVIFNDLNYSIKDGSIQYGNVVLSPVLMWIDAFELLLLRMKEKNIPFHRIRAISGSAQQHTAVYWSNLSILKNLSVERNISEQVTNMLLLQNVPIWMDSSTTRECQEFEAALGGALKVASITGSRAYERFTGMQIKKLYCEKPDLYMRCERISLLSAFFTSLLIQDYASIDYSDGAGMNLMNIWTKDWEQDYLDTVAPMLREKLGVLQPSYACAGTIGKYFVEKYGFASDTQIVNWSGDNPCSLAALPLGHTAINLGTSDTIFGISKNPVPSDIGHIFPNPIAPDSYMVMLCFKNADLTRKRIRDNISWEEFNEILRKTPIGNNGNTGFYYDLPEITPPGVVGDYRFDASGNPVAKFDRAVECRAVIEGQCSSMLKYSQKLGIKTDKIVVSGGASTNKEILKILSSIFNCETDTSTNYETSLIGSAYRAIHGYRCFIAGKYIGFNKILSNII